MGKSDWKARGNFQKQVSQKLALFLRGIAYFADRLFHPNVS